MQSQTPGRRVRESGRCDRRTGGSCGSEQRGQRRVAGGLGARVRAAEAKRLVEQLATLLRSLVRRVQRGQAERRVPVLRIEAVHERERAVGVSPRPFSM